MPQLEKRIDQDIIVARTLIAQKKKDRALLALKKKKLSENQLQSIQAYLMNVEDMVSSSSSSGSLVGMPTLADSRVPAQASAFLMLDQEHRHVEGGAQGQRMQGGEQWQQQLSSYCNTCYKHCGSWRAPTCIRRLAGQRLQSGGQQQQLAHSHLVAAGSMMGLLRSSTSVCSVARRGAVIAE